MHAIPDPMVRRQLESNKPATRKQARKLVKAERQTLRLVQRCLKETGICHGQGLARRAWSNQYLRESHLRKGMPRLLLRLRALLLCPTTWKRVMKKSRKH